MCGVSESLGEGLTKRDKTHISRSMFPRSPSRLQGGRNDNVRGRTTSGFADEEAFVDDRLLTYDELGVCMKSGEHARLPSPQKGR